MGINDLSWRRPSQKPGGSTQLQQPSNIGRARAPSLFFQIPQTARTLAPPGKPDFSRLWDRGAMATLPENGSLVRDTPTNNEKDLQQQHGSSTKTRVPNIGLPRLIHPVNLLKHEFKRGMIINAPLFQEDRNQGKSLTSNVSIAPHGPVYSKPRFMIVVGLNYSSYTTVSIYTHSQKGLLGKEKMRHEYISVRDGRIPRGEFKKLSDYNELVTDGTGARIHEMSTVWLTNPVSRDYDLSVRCHGRLIPESTKRLLQYVREATDKSLGL